MVLDDLWRLSTTSSFVYPELHITKPQGKILTLRRKVRITLAWEVLESLVYSMTLLPVERHPISKGALTTFWKGLDAARFISSNRITRRQFSSAYITHTIVAISLHSAVLLNRIPGLSLHRPFVPMVTSVLIAEVNEAMTHHFVRCC